MAVTATATPEIGHFFLAHVYVNCRGPFDGQKEYMALRLCVAGWVNGEWLFLARQTAVKVQLSIIHKIAHTSALITHTPRVRLSSFACFRIAFISLARINLIYIRTHMRQLSFLFGFLYLLRFMVLL